MSEMRTITAVVAAEDLDAALRNSGAGVSETLGEALRQYNHRAASQTVPAAEAQVTFGLDWRELRRKDNS
jgi:hypothetical protein